MHQPTRPARRLVWGVRGAFTLGAVASLAANILHADDNGVSRTIAGWPPVALVLAVELISRIPVQRRWLAAVRLVATATLAGIAAWVSYWHMVEVIHQYGETGSAPYLIPLSVDGLMVVASVCLVEIGHGAAPVAEVIPDPEPARNPRGYVKATAREVVRSRPDATVPELVAALVDQTGTHTKHATKTVKGVLMEGATA